VAQIILPQQNGILWRNQPKPAASRPATALTEFWSCGILKPMRAVVITRPGGPDVLELRELPTPSFGPEEVRVRVRATAVNRADLLQRRGRYPAPPGSPAQVPGLEFSGEVEACGERVRGLRLGDRVMGILGGGGCSEQVVLHERLCLPIPPAMTWEEAAAIPEAFLTGYDALYRRGGLSPGEAVLVHAAGSGVGTATVQLAMVGGARPIALSRTPEKRRRLEQMGLLHVLDPSTLDLADSIRVAAGGDGVDLVVDLLGASAWPLYVDVLRRCGRLVLIGLMGGSRVELDLARLMTNRLTVVGSVLRSRPLEEKIALVREFARRILPLFVVGSLRPVVDRALPLDAVATAHALLERNETFGKVVLTLDRRPGDE
jgi:putative PIG3 family NAD(P)H quinone oxidoreductase